MLTDGTTITPGLATSWSLSKDGTTYTFDLRKGAVYSDGTPVTSSDVKFSLEPFLALYYVPFVNGVSNKVHGFPENPLGYFNLEGVTKS